MNRDDLDQHLCRKRQVLIVATSAVAFMTMLLLHLEDERAPYYTMPFGGQKWTDYLLYEARSDLFKEITRLERSVFIALAKELRSNSSLTNSRYISVEEQLLIFLDIVGHNHTMRDAASRFARGLDSISRCFNNVLMALVGLYTKYVTQPRGRDAARFINDDDPKFREFRNCIGAIDGVHIPAHVPLAAQAAWRNRKGFISQNVLAAVNFDFTFTYVLAGWEGSAHDTRVLNDALSKNFRMEKNKYYLADAGYAFRDGFLTPYRGVRYHLKEQALAGLRPANRFELFNLRHASLRNIIERVFGVLKRKFSILRQPPEYPLNKQILLVYALCTLWNFLRAHEQLDDNEELNRVSEEEDQAHIATQSQMPASSPDILLEDERMKARREDMAGRMWRQYREYLLSRESGQ